MAQTYNSSLSHLIKSGKTKEFTQIVKSQDITSAVLNEQDGHGRSALHYCVLSNLSSHCQLLLSSGANANLQDAQGYTAFHLAVSKSDQNHKQAHSVSCANILAFYPKYDWTIRDSLGRTVLHSMLISNETKLFLHIINTILSNSNKKNSDNDSNSKNNNDNSDVKMNENKENKENTENKEQENINEDQRVSLSKSINLQSKSGQTVMHLAVSLKQENVVQALLNLKSISSNNFNESNDDLIDLIDLTLKDKDNRLAIDCNSINNNQNQLLNSNLSQLLEQQTVLQMGQKEKKRIENEKVKSQNQFKTKTVVVKNKNNNEGTTATGKSKNKKGGKKKKMKIKLKK